jgi:hypothetical protein
MSCKQFYIIISERFADVNKCCSVFLECIFTIEIFRWVCFGMKFCGFLIDCGWGNEYILEYNFFWSSSLFLMHLLRDVFACGRSHVFQDLHIQLWMLLFWHWRVLQYVTQIYVDFMFSKTNRKLALRCDISQRTFIVAPESRIFYRK